MTAVVPVLYIVLWVAALYGAVWFMKKVFEGAWHPLWLVVVGAGLLFVVLLTDTVGWFLR